MITEGQRSVRWTQGHAIRLRIHLSPFVDQMGLSEITAGTEQEYRVHRMSSRGGQSAPAQQPACDRQGARLETPYNEISTLR